MERHFSTGQSPQWAVVAMEEEEKKKKKTKKSFGTLNRNVAFMMATVALCERSEQTLTTHCNSTQKESGENLNIYNYSF